MPKIYRCKKCNSAPQHCNCYRTCMEKCPHRNPVGKCPQCNLARSFDRQSTSQEEHKSEINPKILLEVREFLNQEKELRNCSITNQLVSEDVTPSTVVEEIVQEERKD